MKLKPALAAIAFLLLPAWATAQVLPAVAEAEPTAEVRVEVDSQDQTRGSDPIPGVDIMVRKNPTGYYNVMFRATTDADGAFAFANLEPGEYTVELTYDGTTTVNAASLELNIAVTRNGLDNREPLPTTFAARSDGKALPPVLIAVNPNTTTYVASANGGVWKSTSFPTVELTLEVTERGNVLHGKVSENENHRFASRPGTEVWLDIDPVRTSTTDRCDGTVTRRCDFAAVRPAEFKSDPVPGVDIIVKQGAGPVIFQATTDADGAFAFANLALGEYTLAFSQTGATVEAERSLELYIAVSPNGIVNHGSSKPSGIPRPMGTNYVAGENGGIWKSAYFPTVELRLGVTEQGNLLRGRVTTATNWWDCAPPGRPQLTRRSSDRPAGTPADDGFGIKGVPRNDCSALKGLSR